LKKKKKKKKKLPYATINFRHQILAKKKKTQPLLARKTRGKKKR
jgi:hypothetical protein